MKGTSKWNVKIRYMTNSVVKMGVHTGLLFVLAIAYWNPICQSVRNLEKEEGLLNNDYKKFYKTCLIGLFFMIVVQ